MIMGSTIKCCTHIKTGKTPKHVIWRFRIRNYFRKMYKFRDFMNTLTIVYMGYFDYLLYIGGGRQKAWYDYTMSQEFFKFSKIINE